MKPEELALIQETIRETIEKTVNGRIEALHTKIDAHIVEHKEDMAETRAHMEEVKPYLQGAMGIKVLGDAWKWLLGLGITWALIKGYIPKL